MNPRTRPWLPYVLLAPLALAACANLDTGHTTPHVAAQAAPAPPPSALAPYLATLADMAPGDPARQQATLATALAAAQQSPSAANRLRYALALGSAGRTGSDPVEAKRLVTEILAGPNDLAPEELELANACLREFDARVALYAELARQREESNQKLLAVDRSADKREEALTAENAKLRKRLAEAERKLEAVAEMERSLQEPTPAPGTDEPQEKPAMPPRR
jgi:hypothetical protein